MIPAESRFEPDPAELLADDAPVDALPEGWVVEAPRADDPADVAGLVALLRAHEAAGRGWASADEETVLVEVSPAGERTRANVVVRDERGAVRAWGSVHDRAAGRMLFVHVVGRDLPGGPDGQVARRCSALLLDWAEGQAREVGAARGLAVQQIDTGAFADDHRQQAWLAERGYARVRRWWQMSRPVVADEVELVPDPHGWEADGVRVRRVRREGGPGTMPDEDDLRAVHQVLEGAFTDHFNSREETFAEFVHRLREDPGHRWDHWWLAELLPGDGDEGTPPEPAGALVASVSTSGEGQGPDGSYVDYLGVLASARGRGVAKRLLSTVVADAAVRGRDRVGLEVDASSPTGADGLYTSMGWATTYTTESWHLDVPVPD